MLINNHKISNNMRTKNINVSIAIWIQILNFTIINYYSTTHRQLFQRSRDNKSRDNKSRDCDPRTGRKKNRNLKMKRSNKERKLKHF